MPTEIQRLESLGARRVRYVENDPDESHWPCDAQIPADLIARNSTAPVGIAVNENVLV